MERVDLDALEAALAKATPGPWRRGSRHDYVVVHLDHGYIVADEDIEDDSPERVEADTDAIISAHNALPALIAELRELRKEAARARWCEEARAVELDSKTGIAPEVLEGLLPDSAWLAQREREAAAKELEGVWNRWCRDESYGTSIWGLWWFVYDRAAALRAGKGGE